jgi:CubicO group peptidase (beta-lactamase class C family)
VLVWEILERFGMTDSVPGADVVNPLVIPPGTFRSELQEQFARALRQLAVPYKVNKKGEASRSELTDRSIDTSSGVISTVRDLARFDQALTDPGVLLAPETLALAWTNARTSSGASLPHALGWFVQTYENKRVVWQFGAVDDGYSSLIVKIPVRDVTLIMLANSDGLTAPFQLSSGDVTASPFAKAFLRLFP